VRVIGANSTASTGSGVFHIPFTPYGTCKYAVNSGFAPCPSDHGNQRSHQTNW
jgi:hypothetical protein